MFRIHVVLKSSLCSLLAMLVLAPEKKHDSSRSDDIFIGHDFLEQYKPPNCLFLEIDI